MDELRGHSLRSQPASGNSPSPSASGSAIPWAAAKGPVRILCDEIGYPFDKRLERPDVLVAFVRELVDEIASEREIAVRLVTAGAPAPTEASREVLDLMLAALSAPDIRGARNLAAVVHEADDRLNPDGGPECDHLIDMLSSCASAVRFGLSDDRPVQSRHAAEAASHVFRRLYGVRRFDSVSADWGKAFARAKLQSAVLSLMTPATHTPAPVAVTGSLQAAEGEARSEVNPSPILPKGEG